MRQQQKESEQQSKRYIEWKKVMDGKVNPTTYSLLSFRQYSESMRSSFTGMGCIMGCRYILNIESLRDARHGQIHMLEGDVTPPRILVDPIRHPVQISRLLPPILHRITIQNVPIPSIPGATTTPSAAFSPPRASKQSSRPRCTSSATPSCLPSRISST